MAHLSLGLKVETGAPHARALLNAAELFLNFPAQVVR